MKEMEEMKEEEEEPKNKRKKGKVRKYRTTTNNTQTTPKQHPNNTQLKGWNPPLGNRKDVDVKPGSAWPVCRGSFSKSREFDLGWYSRSN
jgi:hypothetical protein